MEAVTRRAFLKSTGAAGAGLLLAGCGGLDEPTARGFAAQGRMAAGDGVGYDGPRVELGFWNGFTGGDRPFMVDFVDVFNREHPNVQVKMNVILWADYYQKVTSAVASGNGPAIGVMQVDQIPTAAAHRILVPLDDVASELGLREADFGGDVWKAGQVGGKRFGIPLDVHPIAMYVNHAVLERAGMKPGDVPRATARRTSPCSAS